MRVVGKGNEKIKGPILRIAARWHGIVVVTCNVRRVIIDCSTSSP